VLADERDLPADSLLNKAGGAFVKQAGSMLAKAALGEVLPGLFPEPEKIDYARIGSIVFDEAEEATIKLDLEKWGEEIEGIHREIRSQTSKYLVEVDKQKKSEFAKRLYNESTKLEKILDDLSGPDYVDPGIHIYASAAQLQLSIMAFGVGQKDNLIADENDLRSGLNRFVFHVMPYMTRDDPKNVRERRIQELKCADRLKDSDSWTLADGERPGWLSRSWEDSKWCNKLRAQLVLTIRMRWIKNATCRFWDRRKAGDSSIRRPKDPMNPSQSQWWPINEDQASGFKSNASGYYVSPSADGMDATYTFWDQNQCAKGLQYFKEKLHTISDEADSRLIYLQDLVWKWDNLLFWQRQLERASWTFTSAADGSTVNLGPLTWTQRDSGQLAMTWDEANRYCRDLDHADSKNWRLPKFDELRALQADLIKSYTYGPFQVIGCSLWSSMKTDRSHARAWVWCNYPGKEDLSMDLKRTALCVHE
jgi:hypothetical protein